jgi:hypothetical protein
MAVMLGVASLAFVWQARSRSMIIWAGILAALSVLAWQANIFLLPALFAGIRIQLGSNKEWIRRSGLLLAAIILTLGVFYAAAASSNGIWNPLNALGWLSSYGGAQASIWGRWRERCGELAHLVHSTIGWFSPQPLRFAPVV